MFSMSTIRVTMGLRFIAKHGQLSGFTRLILKGFSKLLKGLVAGRGFEPLTFGL